MRVETKPTVQSGMVKKKHRLRKQQKDANEFPDSSDEGGVEASHCPHVNKAVNLNLVKKAIKTHGITGDCVNCKGDGVSKTSTVTETTDQIEVSGDTIEPTVWLCLQCGNQGCDRNSKEKHALKHYETPRTGSHDLCYNLTTSLVWCYCCDDEVSVEVSKKLVECTEFVKKQMGVAPTHHSTAGKKIAPYKIPEPQLEEATSNQDVKEVKQKSDKQNKSKAVAVQTQHALLGLPKVRGLSNLGNTCFFNAVMQNLSQTPILVTMLNERIQKGTCIQLTGRQISADTTDSEDSAHNSGEEDLKEPKVELNPLSITLGDGGTLTSSLLSFMKDMHNSTGKGQVVTPSTLFGQVCKKAPRFKGFQQQDSHELLRCLLDSMKAEEVKRSQSGILSAFSLPSNINNRQVDDDTKVKVKCYGTQVKHTFVDSIFGGVFISTVQCEECQMHSQIFEPFLDVSLPVTEEKTVRPGNLGRKKDTIVSNNTAHEETSTKPSKHMTKKERKKSRKEGKKKKRTLSQSSKDQVLSPITDSNDKVSVLNNQEKNKEAENNDGDSMEESGSSEGAPDDTSEKTCNKNQSGDLMELPGGQIADNEVQSPESMVKNSLQELNLQEIKDQKGDNDTDSNKANIDANLSDSDADVEDNIDGNRISPVDERLKDFNCCGVPSDGAKNCDISVEATVTKVKSGTCNSDISCSNNLEPTGDNGLNIYSSSIKTEEELSENAFKGNNVNNITESLKHINIANDGCDSDDVKRQHFNKSDSLENTYKISNNNIKQHLNNNSKAPHSPNLSRNSSLRVSFSKMSSQSLSKSSKIEARREAMRSLAGHRYQPESSECSVQSCLNQFTAAELLTGNNKFGCKHCTKQKKSSVDNDGKKELVYTNANKQLLIFSPPAVLTLHMKRFQQIGYSLRKVNRHVDFPLILDLAPYCSTLSEGIRPGQNKVLYSLYGMVEHSGRLTGGHYTAYVKVRPNSSHNVKAFLHHQSVLVKLDKVLVENFEKMTMASEAGAVGGSVLQDDEDVTGEPPAGKWYYISDSRVTETTESNVLRCQAYLLFYERIY